jgi:hypothetical protein
LASTLLAVQEALLFVTDLDSDMLAPVRALEKALQRMGVAAARCQVVALAERPDLGARWNVRVTPCLVLDTGSRQVLLPGDPAQLDAGCLEQALARP